VDPVSYIHRFEYGYDQNARRLPLLKFRVSNISDPTLMVDVEGALDSGAERSLLNGRIGVALGFDVLGGPRLNFETMGGSLLAATLQRVRLSHPKLGTFELEVAFSTGDIQRNLFGRDFFDLVQIGFREHHLAFYVTPSP
jgi:hypothetical protein